MQMTSITNLSKLFALIYSRCQSLNNMYSHYSADLVEVGKSYR